MQHHLKLVEMMLRRSCTNQDKDALKEASEKFAEEAITVGIYITALRAKQLGTCPNSFHYFLPEIETAHTALQEIADKHAYIGYLQGKWNILKP